VVPITARRAFDSRVSGAKVAARSNRFIRPSSLGTPLGSSAVTVTVAVVGAEGPGALGIGPCGGTPWIVNVAAGATQVFSGIIRTNDAGVCITPTVPMHVVIDVTAVWRTSGGDLGALAPSRVFDSRPGGVDTAAVTVPSGAPAGATRAQYIVTVVGGATGGSLFVWNCSATRPTASVAHAAPGHRTATTVTIDVAGGTLCVATSARVQVVIDLVASG